MMPVASSAQQWIVEPTSQALLDDGACYRFT
jgi:hypothetical protein